MILFAMFQSAAGAPAEPILISGLVAGSGVGLLWVARKIMVTSERVRDIHLFLFGLTEDHDPDKGWVNKLNHVTERLGTIEYHIAHCPITTGVLQQQVSDLLDKER